MDALTFLEEQLELRNLDLVSLQNTSVEDRVQARLDELQSSITEEETAKLQSEIHEMEITVKGIKNMIANLQASSETEGTDETVGE